MSYRTDMSGEDPAFSVHGLNMQGLPYEMLKQVTDENISDIQTVMSQFLHT